MKCTWELLIHKEWITTVENMCSFLVGVVFTAYLARAVIFAKVLYALLWCDDIQEGTHLSFMQQEDECCASFSCFRLWKGAPALHDWGSEFKKGVIKDKELKHSLRSRSCGKADPGRCLHKCAQLLLSHHTGSLKKGHKNSLKLMTIIVVGYVVKLLHWSNDVQKKHVVWSW